MPAMTVRNLPEDVHRRIRLYAAEHGLCAEAASAPIGQADAQIAAITRDITPFETAGLTVINPWDFA